MTEIAFGTIPARGFDFDEVSFPTRRINTFATLRYGKALAESNRTHGIVPVYGTNGRCGWHDQALIPGPGVILGRKGQGHLGVEWCETPFWVIDTAYFVELDKKAVDLRWFYFLVKYVGLDHLKTGEKPGLPRELFHSQIVPFPSMSEQRGISALLGALDEKIALNRRMNHTLEATAKALFRSWFVDFDPVFAKADGRRAPGVPDAVQRVMPLALVDSELGPIPAGWSVDPIGSLARCLGGSTPSTANESYWNQGGIRWATPKDLAALEFPVIVNTERRISSAGAEQISSGLLPRGAVLLSSRAPIGYLAVAAEPMAVNQGFIAMVCDGALPNWYVLHWVRENMESIVSRANGTTFMEINKRNFRPIPALRPPPEILNEFVRIVEPLHLLIERHVRESLLVGNLRDMLLPPLLSGAMRLRDAERVVAEVSI